MAKYKFTTTRQVGGNDGCCWSVFVRGREVINGLTRREADYYRQRFEREEREKVETKLRHYEDLRDSAKSVADAEEFQKLCQALAKELAHGSR